jgi:hypothetical protein
MEDILLIVVYLTLAVLLYLGGAVHGWNARERYAERRLRDFVKEHLPEEVPTELHPITIEKHNDTLFVYDKKTKQFLAQGTSAKEVEQALEKRYPGKKYACSPEELNLLRS